MAAFTPGPRASVGCVKGEIHNVLSVMRQNRRWASEARFQREISLQAESPIMRAFKTLHARLEPVSDLSEVDSVTYLSPFLDVIRSRDTSGPITGAALSSLNKFLLYGFVTPVVPRAREAINQLAVAVADCRFEATDAESDEVVLTQVLELLVQSLRCAAGPLLSDANVWGIVQSCLSISRQPGGSLLLRRTAENALGQAVLTVFSGLSDESPESDSEEAEASEESDEERPYGIPVMRDVLVMLAQQSNPRKKSATERVLALTLLNIVLETAGPSLGAHPRLVQVLQGDLCKFLLLNSTTATDNASLSLTLRVVFNLFNSITDHLKVQLEVFFTSVHLRILDSPSSTPEVQELALESVLEFCREPALMLDLYVNYDCDVHCTNLFETLCRTLARRAVPDGGGSLNILNRLAVEGLLEVLSALSARCAAEQLQQAAEANHHPQLTQLTRGESTETDEDYDDDLLAHARARTAEALQERKRKKQRLLLCAERFNAGDKQWPAYAVELGLLRHADDPEAVAALLRQTPGLDKEALGEFLAVGPADEHPFHARVLDAYAASFDFHGALTLDEGMRRFLETFRLPGEAQKIDRIIEAFAKRFHAQADADSPLADADTTFVLAFSVIMLNTDLHSSQIAAEKKMTLDEFVRNNRGINAGGDVPREYLETLYDRIKREQIRMMTDVAELQAGANVEWDGVMQRQQAVMGASFTPVAARGRVFRAGVHERAMFAIVADAAISALSFAYEHTTDSGLVSRVAEGFENYARIAVFFDMRDAFNHLVIALCRFVQQGGLRDRAAGTLVTVFGLARRYAGSLAEGWVNVVDLVLLLHSHGALPPGLVELDDFADARGVPVAPSAYFLAPGVAPASAADSNAEQPQGGLWSGLSSYLWAPAEPAAGAGDQGGPDVGALLREAAPECQVDQLFARAKALPDESLSQLLRALILARDPLVFQHSSSASSSAASFTHEAVLVLELATNAALANHQRAELVWPLLTAYFGRVLQAPGATAAFPYVTERLVVSLLRVCIRLGHASGGLAPALDLLTALPAGVAAELAERVAAGMLALVRSVEESEAAVWESIFRELCRAFHAPRARPVVLEAATVLVEGRGGRGSNVATCLHLLTLFAREGSAEEAAVAAGLMRKLCGGRGGSPTDTDTDSWFAVLHALREMAADEREDVARAAVEALQGALLAPDAGFPAAAWQRCFDDVLFKLAVPKTGVGDRRDDAQLRNAKLVVHVFLHCVPELPAEVHVLWLRLAGHLARVARDGGDFVRESVVQALRNVVMVLSADGVFRAASEASGQDVVELTWRALGEELKGEVEGALLVGDPPGPGPVPGPVPVEAGGGAGAE